MGRERNGQIAIISPPSLSSPKSLAQEREKTSRPGLWDEANHVPPRVTKAPATRRDPGRAPLRGHRRQGALPARRPGDRRSARSPGCKENAGGPRAKLHSPEAAPGGRGEVPQKPPPPPPPPPGHSVHLWSTSCIRQPRKERPVPMLPRGKPAQRPQDPHGPERGSDGWSWDPNPFP